MGQKRFLFDETESYMLELLRYGVLDKEPMALLSPSQVDWDKMMDMASAQGLLAWVWDGICKLPKEYRPPRQQSINWGLSAQEIWDRYNKQKRVLMQMIDVCNQNNIRLLLFKGIAVSELFPRPESRPSSDIDIYLFDDYKRGDQIFAKENVTRTNKRTGFDYQGVHIENHRIFLNTYTEIQIEAIKYLEESLTEVICSKDGYYVLEPISCIVYQVMHFIAHIDDITSPPSLRFIVDFGMILRHYRIDSEMDKLKKVLERLCVLEIYSLMVLMVEEVLGSEYNNYHFSQVQTKNLRGVYEIIMSRPKETVSLMNKSFFERLSMYFSRYCQLRGLFKFLPVKRHVFVSKAL